MVKGTSNKLLAAIACCALVFLSCHSGEGTSRQVANQPPAQTQTASAQKVNYEMVDSFPHDSDAFLQGLVWHDGGLYGESTLRRVEFPSGKVLKKINLSPDLFGEGLALAGDRLVQLTWQAHRG